MGLKDEQIVASDPPEEEEEEEEEDIVDPHDTLRENCRGEDKCMQLKEVMESCNDRVNSKSNTSENCMQELYDFVHCVDTCASKSLFPKLK
ncbi:hypothetical protein CAPTEDRAFT_228304 [Capitella teleta]|uniref:Cytochrome b-c1 complex subunit 6 n=1 Tax=Capitella teleta TaxID=283909 RepID=R7USS6_CAPTE|nr:hypothetical protein CAPTEDRAFT_228304 [Capitella teleta]|eukprot:ELU06456.1 hypothetical protein CAPTEDRAFT_228304 [Capitella teleta]